MSRLFSRDFFADKISVADNNIYGSSTRQNYAGNPEPIFIKKHIAGVVLLCGMTLLVAPFSAFILSQPANAATISLSVSDSITATAMPSSGNNTFTSDTNTTNIKVKTDNISGYTLSLKSNSSTAPALNGSGSNKINSISEQKATIESFSNGTWGYKPTKKINGIWSPLTVTQGDITYASGHYLPGPTSAGDILDITDAANTTDNEYNLAIATKIGGETAIGNYSNSFVVAAVANEVPEITFDIAYQMAGKSKVFGTDYYSMQDMTMAICGSVGNWDVDTDAPTTQLVDTRDNKIYYVSKLKDGNCWMTQNLDLGSSAGSITLTPANSDVASNFTLTTPGTANFDSPNYDVINYRDPGEQYYVSSGTTSNDTVYTSKSACESAKGAELCAHSHAGNYYNWYTATAGTGTQAMTSGEATSSICPAGWRLPTNSSDSGAKSYYNLVGGISDIRSNPLYFIRSGNYSGLSLSNAGVYGYYWSSTVGDSYSARSLYFSSGYVYPQDYYDKYYGFSVRCLVRNIPTDFVLEYDQNTTDTVASMPASQTLSNYDGETMPITISSQAPTRSGYYFGGWATASDGDSKYFPGSALYLSASDMPDNGTLTLHAKWYDSSAFIKFAIDGDDYIATLGSTWADWVNSQYSVNKYCVYSNQIRTAETCNSYYHYYISGAKPSDLIVAGASYSLNYECFVKGTEITLSDGNKKKIEDMTYDDKVLVWNFDEGRYDEASIAWLTAAGLHNDHYYKLTFSDGTVLKTTGTNSNHKVFNADEQYFQGVSSIEVGTHVYTENGIVTLVDKEYIEEDVEYYNIITTTHFNVFANGVLTGNRYDNMYDIANMKYIKDNRTIRPYSDFEPYNIDRYWYDTLRLGEQSDSMEEIVDYIHKLESQMRERNNK